MFGELMSLTRVQCSVLSMATSAADVCTFKGWPTTPALRALVLWSACCCCVTCSLSTRRASTTAQFVLPWGEVECLLSTHVFNEDIVDLWKGLLLIIDSFSIMLFIPFGSAFEVSFSPTDQHVREMDKESEKWARILWDYLCLPHSLEKASLHIWLYRHIRYVLTGFKMNCNQNCKQYDATSFPIIFWFDMIIWCALLASPKITT